MGVERSMKIFFEGMQGQFIDGGYGPRIVSTPMGPFRWNDHRELWENVNNGMVLNNISFQDMMTMGYETLGGGADYIEVPDRSATLSGSFGNINGVTDARATRWASTTGPQSLVANASSVTFTSLNRTISISLVSTLSSGTTNIGMRWSRNNASALTYTTPFTINNGDTLKIAGTFPDTTGIPEVASGSISVINQSDGNAVLTTIPWSYTI